MFRRVVAFLTDPVVHSPTRTTPVPCVFVSDEDDDLNEAACKDHMDPGDAL